jgi:hypothetical protein
MAEGIEFNEDPTPVFRPSYGISGSVPQSQTPTSLTGFIQKIGLAENESRAQYILIGIAVACFIVAAYVAIFHIAGVGKANAIVYDIPEELINKYPPDIQAKIRASKK